jgi:hypothetical protein
MRIPLQLQQSAIVRVGDLANVSWATRRPGTRRVAREAQTRAKNPVAMWLVGGRPRFIHLIGKSRFRDRRQRLQLQGFCESQKRPK